MKKRTLAMVLTLVVAVSAAGCGADTGKTNSTETNNVKKEATGEKPTASGEKLVVGTLANWVGLPVWYAERLLMKQWRPTSVILLFQVWLLCMLYQQECINILAMAVLQLVEKHFIAGRTVKFIKTDRMKMVFMGVKKFLRMQ